MKYYKEHEQPDNKLPMWCNHHVWTGSMYILTHIAIDDSNELKFTHVIQLISIVGVINIVDYYVHYQGPRSKKWHIPSSKGGLARQAGSPPLRMCCPSVLHKHGSVQCAKPIMGRQLHTPIHWTMNMMSWWVWEQSICGSVFIVWLLCVLLCKLQLCNPRYVPRVQNVYQFGNVGRG